MKGVVSASWLRENLGRTDVKVLDGSWYLPGDPRNPRRLFEHERIPGAQYFDIETICDHTAVLPHMLPSTLEFQASVRSLGVNQDDTVVIYAHQGSVSAPRIWWMFRVFGYDNVRVLNGGFEAWRDEGGAIDTHSLDAATGQPNGDFVAGEPRTELLADFAQVEAASQQACCQILDARAPDRFSGQVPELRPGVRSGHIPHSRNIPYSEVWDGGRGELRSEAELKSAFTDLAGADAPIITTCGSGVSACILALALFELGYDTVAVYDGSWTEWGSRADARVAVSSD
ncbi:mercaptopyruvate sulfurtransferase [Luminiphilus syltensis NOR5-1B]|uniref:Sulfurtransferase n=1 Tax=Luminiphilus syltensis NOR5-1B TaxID=565045 RepID=B8KXV8_9GAMM|nr:rhodanese-like domain-containing protein [Luminiphilus syltensis]EED36677.1 mercaptopyruvate sulfurtransferase [Luminiphilus syltensis NOR5-1B]